MTQTLDPVVASDQIAADYRRYLRSLLPVGDPALAEALDREIAGTQLLTRGPLLEANPAYLRGATLNDLIDEGVLPREFARFDSAALPIHRSLYSHQEASTRKSRAGRNLVVSTGTGSGKTESFLIPILASLADEMAAGPLTPGVRALLLYPMNALANDQMKRLRQVLAAVPEVTFGRYIGDTPQGKDAAERGFELLNPGEPRLPNELLSREEMQATPPHLLLTNYAMLEYLLLRPDDMVLFEGEGSGHWRFIVVDEAHVYDGARGSELAMLLRRLQDRVPAVAMQCIATSATVGADSAPAAVTAFAANLFGAPFEWEPTVPARQDLVRAERVALPPAAWGPLNPRAYLQLAASGDIASDVALLAPAASAQQSPYDTFAAEAVMASVRGALAQGSRTLEGLCQILGEPWTPDDVARIVEVGGRFADDTGVPLLSARYHLWVRAAEGAFTCMDPRDPHVHLARQEACPTCRRPAYEFGACTRCGTVHVIGNETVEAGHTLLRPRLSMQETPTWLALTRELTAEDEDDEAFDDESVQSADAVELCIDCGALAPEGTPACLACGGMALRSARIIQGHSRVLKGCVACGSRTRGQVRLLDTGADASAAVLATSLYQNLPPDSGAAGDHPGEGRKLLAFSDSRQGAAYFAPYLDSSYRRLFERRMLLAGITQASEAEGGPAALQDVVADVVSLSTTAGIFERRATRREKEREVGLWLARELVAMDERQSLEGLGMIEFVLDDPENLGESPVWAELGLSKVDAISLVTELLRSVRRQGAVTFPEGVDAADEAFSPRLGPIYVRDRKTQPKVLSWLPTRGTNRRLDYLTRVLEAAGSTSDPADVLEGIWRMLSRGREPRLKEFSPGRLGIVYQVDHTWLRARARPAGDSVFACDTCGVIAGVSVLGVCPTMRCPGRLVPSPLPDPSTDRSHYRLLYRTLAPIPMSVREHTAQWQARDAAEIQNQFIRGEINALSCSTTFELGVDVGELQAVFLRNVPPATANYVQRAGRAGRRTASAALVVTFAQRRSHDLTRFAEPQTMINGQVRAPLIPLGNERIDRRHAHSVALSAFFRHSFVTSGLKWRKAGEFFHPAPGSDEPIGLLRAFLDPVPPDVLASLERVLPADVQREIDLAGGGWVEQLLQHVADVRSEVADEIEYFEAARLKAFESRKDALAGQLGKVVKTLEGRDLLGFLGSRNILPKYGFPVDVVELRTANSENPVGLRLDLTRDLASAIYEYAPGAEIVAGGLVWKSAGVYRLPDRELVSGTYAECKNCHHFEHSLDTLEPYCPDCAGDRTVQSYAIPEFGFLAERSPMKAGGSPPSRSWNGATYFVQPGVVLETGFAPRGREGVMWSLNASRRATMMAISNGPTRNGFLICDWCGRGLSPTGKLPKQHPHAWKNADCTGPLKRRSLAHRYETDVLEIDIRSPRNIDEGEYWSLLYGVLESAADVLSISRDDIGGTLALGGGTAKLVLFDTVPGGAGCVLQIPPRIDDIIRRAITKISACECGEETSCYSCLRGFRNQTQHDLISRRAALDMLGLL